MKKLILIILLSPFTLFGTNSKTLKSTIESVTVYQQGAQIQRKAHYSIDRGITVISIEGVSQRIDTKSIQVNGTGNMVILDSKYRLEYPSPLPAESPKPTPKLDKELNLLNDSVMNIDYQLIGLQQQLDVLTTQKKILNSNGAIQGVGKVNDSIPLLKDALNYYYEKMNAIYAETLELTIKKNKLTSTKKRISDRIQVIYQFKNNSGNPKRTTNKPVSLIEITISASAPVSGKLSISYMVQNAGWSPLYDIRSSSSKKNVDLTYKAHVYQNTGVDWNKTKLILSTSNPYTNKTKPNLRPYYIRYSQNKYTTNREVVSQRQLEDLYDDNESQLDMEEIEKDKSSPAPAVNSSITGIAKENNSSHAYQHVMLNEQLISVQYEINLPYSIPSNNEQHLVLVRRETLKSNYNYYTAPKLDLGTYLVAEITDLDDLNLIPGIANIFHDGTYVGETNINPSIMADSLSLSLGRDQDIQVKRTLLQKDSKTKIIGDKTEKTYAFLTEIKNHKSSPLTITLQDQVPVTLNPDITVEIEEISKGKLNEVTGLIDWDLKLKPKETVKVKLVYTVSYSKNRSINLAQN